MGPLEKEICIKCDKGGEVLACADSCCPIAVHVRCMGCPARFDDSGKFYCPYCLYRQSIAKFHQAKEHALSKKKALHTFLDKKMIDNVRESTCERADEPLPEKKSDVPESNSDEQLVVWQQIHSGPHVDCGSKPSAHTSSKATTTDFRVLEAGNGVQVNDLQEVGEHQLEKSVEEHHQDGHLCNSSVAEEETLGNELVLPGKETNSTETAGELPAGVDQTTATFTSTGPSLQHHLHGKRRAETGDSTCGESKSLSTQHECDKQVNQVKDQRMLTDSSRRLTRSSASLLENSNAAGKFVQVKQPSMSPVILPNGKRRRVLWRREEEEMIKEGVQKFSSTVNKNIPWRKILDSGRHVFDHARIPSDLKEKWKKICSKDSGRV